MKKIFALTLIVLVLFVFAPTTVYAAPNTTFTINIYRVQMIDPIENLSEGAADWNYKITVTDDVRTQEITFNDDEYYENDEIVFNNYHTVTVASITVVVSIYLYDADSSGNEVADISGNGVQTTLTFSYDLGTNLITTGDQPQVDGDYYYTSGEFDGSTSSDQNDASLWFQLSDNYVFPVADAGSDKIAATGVATSFDGLLSTASSGSSIELYQWDFDGDDVFDAEGIQASFTFTQRGLYVLTLKVTDNFGRSSVDTCFVNVTSPPVALFSIFPVEPEASDEISFVDSSIDSDGAVISWYWEFGDGYTSTARNPTHQYSVNGTYNIRLTVTDNDGATDTMEFSLFVNATYNLPVANTGADKTVASSESILFDGSLSTASPASFIETY